MTDSFVEVKKPDFAQAKEILIELIYEFSEIENNFAVDIQDFSKQHNKTKINIVTERISNKEAIKKYIMQAFTNHQH